MSENNSIIQISADTSGVARGVQQAERSLNNLAQTAQRSGSQAAGSLNSVGEAAEKSAKKQERASRSIELSLQREIALLQAGERGSRAYYESLAKQRGVDVGHLTPILNQLDSLRKKTDGLTISQGQYNNALRMMPAQMTDVVTQLAGGQSPFLIAIQQGGQMRDMFGGFGNMFKGIAASISPFKLAMGGAVGAIGAVSYAMYAGAKEGREFQNVLTLSGDRAGITADRLQMVADTVGGTTGSFSVARAAVMAFAAEGKIARDDYADFATSVSLMSQATGKDVSELVGEFTKIGDDPVKAVVELSGKYKSMTADVYAQVTALKEQGKEQEAVRLVQKLYADETAEMARQVTENLGWIERGWKNISESASKAWESLKSIGKTQTIEQQIAKLEAENANLSRMEAEFGADTSKERAANQAKLTMLKQEQRVEEELTDAKRAKQLVNENAVKSMDNLRRGAESALPAIAKLRQELKKIDDDLANVRASGDKKAIADAEKWAKAKKAKVHQDIEAEQERERKAAERENRQKDKVLSKYIAPYDGNFRITSGISAGRFHPVLGKVRRHDGVDVAMPVGTPLKAMADGVVSINKTNSGGVKKGYGHYLEIKHDDGRSTRYAHLRELSQFKVGQRVKAGQVVAYSGNTGIGTGAHLHMEARDAKGRLLDFRELIGKQAKNSASRSGMDMTGFVSSKELYAKAVKPDKTDFEKYQEQAAAKQLRDDVERKLRANGKHRVIENELALTSRPEFANWTKEQQNSELAKARAADELATQEKHREMVNAQMAQIQQKHALIGKTTELAKYQYELESGSLKHFSAAEKAILLDKAKRFEMAQKQFDTDQKYSHLIDSLAEKTLKNAQDKEFELSLVGKTASEMERLTLAREYDLHIMQAIADGASPDLVDGLRQQKTAAENARVEWEKIKQAHGENWLAGISDGMTQYVGSFKSMREEMSGLVSQTASGFSDQIANFVATGKANFREFSQSIIQDISKMMIKMAIFNAMKAAGQSMSGAGGWVGAIGSAISGSFSDGGYTGHGGKFEPAGIVHKGEYVLSQENLRALGGVSAVESLLHRAKGYSSGGLVGGGVGVMANIQAAQSSAPVINITINVSGSNKEEARAGAQEGIEAAIPQLVQELADMRIAEHLRPNGMIFNMMKA